MLRPLVELEDVILWITAQIGNQTVTAFAQKIGFNRQSLYDVLDGKVRPSKALRSRLGLKVIYEIVAPEVPAKRKKQKGE